MSRSRVEEGRASINDELNCTTLAAYIRIAGLMGYNGASRYPAESASNGSQLDAGSNVLITSDPTCQESTLQEDETKDGGM